MFAPFLRTAPLIPKLPLHLLLNLFFHWILSCQKIYDSKVKTKRIIFQSLLVTLKIHRLVRQLVFFPLQNPEPKRILVHLSYILISYSELLHNVHDHAGSRSRYSHCTMNKDYIFIITESTQGFPLLINKLSLIASLFILRQ